MKLVASIALYISVMLASCGALGMLLTVGELWKEWSRSLFGVSAVVTGIGGVGICLTWRFLRRCSEPKSDG